MVAEVRSHPYNPQAEGFVLNGSEEIKRVQQAAREKVLDDVWRKWSEHNYTKSLWDILQELRQEGKVE
jgi:hypothetical protein